MHFRSGEGLCKLDTNLGALPALPGSLWAPTSPTHTFKGKPHSREELRAPCVEDQDVTALMSASEEDKHRQSQVLPERSPVRKKPNTKAHEI